MAEVKICMTREAHAYAGVQDLLGECKVAAEKAHVRGVSETLDVCRVAAPR